MAFLDITISDIFQFLIDFTYVMGKWAGYLWDFLTYQITIDDVPVPVWALLSVGAVATLVLVRIFRKAIFGVWIVSNYRNFWA